MGKPTRKPARKAFFGKRDSVGEGSENFTERDETLLAELLEALEAVRMGDFTKKLRTGSSGVMGELATSFNTSVDTINSTITGIVSASKQATEGNFSANVKIAGAKGSWQDLVNSINTLINTYTIPIKAIAKVDTENRVPQGKTENIIQINQGTVDTLNNIIGEIIRIAKILSTQTEPRTQ